MIPSGAKGPAIEQETVLICALSVFDEIGGIQRFNQRVVDVIQKFNNIKLVTIALNDTKDHSSKNFRFYACDRSRSKFIGHFIKVILTDRPKKILLAHVNLLPFAQLAKFMRPAPKIALFVHGIEVWQAEARWFRYWYQRVLLRSSIDAIISVSDFTAKVMESQYSLVGKQFFLLPNAVDADAGREPLKQDASGKARRVLSVTRLADHYKGMSEVISAIALLRRTMPDVEYHVVGDGPIKPELQAHARDLGAEGNIFFHGQVTDDELAAAYENAAVFVLPSRKEGFGIVFLEAWKHGLPVICGNVDASSEVVIDGNCGLVVDTCNIPSIAHAIELLLRDPQRRYRLARNGYRRLLQNYTHDNFAKNFKTIYEDL